MMTRRFILTATLVSALTLVLGDDVWPAGKKRPITPEPTPTSTPTGLPLPSATPTAIASGKPHVGFKCMNCTTEEAKKVAEAEKIVNELRVDPRFRHFMVKRPLIWTNEKTRDQVVDDLASADLTVPVWYYWGKCSVVGYRNVGYPDIHFNRCSHNYYDAVDTASNGFHEWSHVLDYDHPYRSTSTRGYTVPYSLNVAVETLVTRGKGGHGFRGDLMEVKVAPALGISSFDPSVVPSELR